MVITNENDGRWIKISRADIIFNESNIATVSLEEKDICIIRTKTGIKACSSHCPHAGGNLSGGFIDGKENIVCPVHHYRFNLGHGRDSNNEGYFLKIFGVREEDADIWIRLEK